MNALLPLIHFYKPLPVRPYLSDAKKHAAHLACAARYRTQASGLFGLAREGGDSPWGGPPDLLRQNARQAIKFAKQEIEAARAIRTRPIEG